MIFSLEAIGCVMPSITVFGVMLEAVMEMRESDQQRAPLDGGKGLDHRRALPSETKMSSC